MGGVEPLGSPVSLLMASGLRVVCGRVDAEFSQRIHPTRLADLRFPSLLTRIFQNTSATVNMVPTLGFSV